MNNNPLKQLEALGQSIWLDCIRRDLIAGGGLRRLIEEDGLRGMTSNPFNEARRVLEQLPEADINIAEVTRNLENEGVEKFNQSFDKLMATQAQKVSATCDQSVMKTSPLAGTQMEPGMLVNVPRLVTACYTEAPDPAIAAQRMAFGASGHRGSSCRLRNHGSETGWRPTGRLSENDGTETENDGRNEGGKCRARRAARHGEKRAGGQEG